jgi:DNA-binding response OmpR family regulator
MDKHILVVDDDEVVLGAVCKALRPDHYAIDTAKSADEALKLLSGSSYRVVITDLMMPGMDGLELLQRIRDMGAKSETIMITGYPTIQTALRAKRLGAFEYVTKPFTRQELRSVVVRGLRRGGGEPPAPGPAATGSAQPIYYIPEHSWARVEPDGNVVIGMVRAFASAVGQVEEIRFPQLDSLLEQGRVCGVVRAADSVEHTIHSPLTGRVIEINPSVRKDPNLAGRDPEGDGWLLRLVPQDLDREIPNLEPA